MTTSSTKGLRSRQPLPSAERPTRAAAPGGRELAVARAQGLTETGEPERLRSVLIVDDHPIFRQGLRQLVSTEPGFEVVGEAADGAQAHDFIQKHKPDFAILDLELPVLDGLSLARRLEQARVTTRLVVLTMSKNESFFNEAIDVGVKGYVLKDDAANDILQCLRAVSQGQPYLSPALSSFLLRRNDSSRQFAEAKPQLEELTAMERRVLKLIAQNKTSKDIAQELFISPFTVETHRRNIRAKLELSGTQPVLRFALEHRSEL